jgi:hypothetical protein
VLRTLLISARALVVVHLAFAGCTTRVSIEDDGGGPTADAPFRHERELCPGGVTQIVADVGLPPRTARSAELPGGLQVASFGRWDVVAYASLGVSGAGSWVVVAVDRATGDVRMLDARAATDPRLLAVRASDTHASVLLADVADPGTLVRVRFDGTDGVVDEAASPPHEELFALGRSSLEGDLLLHAAVTDVTGELVLRAATWPVGSRPTPERDIAPLELGARMPGAVSLVSGTAVAVAPGGAGTSRVLWLDSDAVLEGTTEIPGTLAGVGSAIAPWGTDDVLVVIERWMAPPEVWIATRRGDVSMLTRLNERTAVVALGGRAGEPVGILAGFDGNGGARGDPGGLEVAPLMVGAFTRDPLVLRGLSVPVLSGICGSAAVSAHSDGIVVASTCALGDDLTLTYFCVEELM